MRVTDTMDPGLCPRVEGEKEELCCKVQQLKETVSATESDLSLTKTTLLQYVLSIDSSTLYSSIIYLDCSIRRRSCSF